MDNNNEPRYCMGCSTRLIRTPDGYYIPPRGYDKECYVCRTLVDEVEKENPWDDADDDIEEEEEIGECIECLHEFIVDSDSPYCGSCRGRNNPVITSDHPDYLSIFNEMCRNEKKGDAE